MYYISQNSHGSNNKLGKDSTIEEIFRLFVSMENETSKNGMMLRNAWRWAIQAYKVPLNS